MLIAIKIKKSKIEEDVLSQGATSGITAVLSQGATSGTTVT